MHPLWLAAGPPTNTPPVGSPSPNGRGAGPLPQAHKSLRPSPHATASTADSTRVGLCLPAKGGGTRDAHTGVSRAPPTGAVESPARPPMSDHRGMRATTQPPQSQSTAPLRRAPRRPAAQRRRGTQRCASARRPPPKRCAPPQTLQRSPATAATCSAASGGTRVMAVMRALSFATRGRRLPPRGVDRCTGFGRRAAVCAARGGGQPDVRAATSPAASGAERQALRRQRDGGVAVGLPIIAAGNNTTMRWAASVPRSVPWFVARG